MLAEQLGRPVELVTERTLSSHPRPHVATDRVTVYEANEVYLRHISDAIHRSSGTWKPSTVPGFWKANSIRTTVVRQLEISGEAGRQLSDAFRDDHSSISWHAVIGMRNRLVHDYFGVDLDVVRDVVHHDLPKPKREVRQPLE